MWEKYGGDGNGFLMELSVVNASCIHTINYQDRSVVVNGVLDDIKRNLRLGYDNQIYSCDLHYRESIKALMQLLYTKETKWKVEKECRVVIPLDNELNGKNYELKRMGLKIENVIAGYRCTDNMLRRLNEVTNSIEGAGFFVTERKADRIEKRVY